MFSFFYLFSFSSITRMQSNSSATEIDQTLSEWSGRRKWSCPNQWSSQRKRIHLTQWPFAYERTFRWRIHRYSWGIHFLFKQYICQSAQICKYLRCIDTSYSLSLYLHSSFFLSTEIWFLFVWLYHSVVCTHSIHVNYHHFYVDFLKYFLYNSYLWFFVDTRWYTHTQILILLYAYHIYIYRIIHLPLVQLTFIISTLCVLTPIPTKIK